MIIIAYLCEEKVVLKSLHQSTDTNEINQSIEALRPPTCLIRNINVPISQYPLTDVFL